MFNWIRKATWKRADFEYVSLLCSLSEFPPSVPAQLAGSQWASNIGFHSAFHLGSWCAVSCRFSNRFIWYMTVTGCLRRRGIFTNPAVFSNCKLRHWEPGSQSLTQILSKMLRSENFVPPRSFGASFPKISHRQLFLRCGNWISKYLIGCWKQIYFLSAETPPPPCQKHLCLH